MISKVAANSPSPTQDSKNTSAYDLDWEKYAKSIFDLKDNPPKKYAVTISEFSLGGTSFPVWQIPDFINAGFDPKSLVAIRDRRMIVTEGFLKILQDAEPGAIRDIVEVDPITEQPLDKKSTNTTISSPLAQAPAPTPPTSAKTALTDTVATKQNTPPAQPQQPKTGKASPSPAHSSSGVTRSAKTQSRHLVLATPSFDFSKLTPEIKKTAIGLAEQLLTAAFQRLKDFAQEEGDASSLLDRTA
jgi:hypothetical protein